MSKVTVADFERTSVRIIPSMVSGNSFTLAGSMGSVKLGQPQPDSNYCRRHQDQIRKSNHAVEAQPPS
jgi:hypothetical protein